MEAYQERVIKEKSELDKKRETLDAFIESDAFDLLDHIDQTLLVIQADAMTTYSGVLAQRIMNFKDESNTE
jgi:crAss001_48 related protein